jgi:anti-anti-sigma factor
MNAQPLTIDVWTDRGVAIVEPHDSILEHDANAFRSALAKADLLARIPAVVIVLDSVGFIDAQALVDILAEHRRLSSRGGRVALTFVQDRVKRLLLLAGCANSLQTFESLEAALNALNPAEPR